ncbi:hypothetical protein DL96DRAFT_1643436 [Flagelloscypha sp. PMI_526]|nr:hypothetical protein DL96DRAFT_1643436 [Flagelloscypha sp. PMI_526]
MYRNYVKLRQHNPDIEDQEESLLSVPNEWLKWRRLAICSIVLNLILITGILTSGFGSRWSAGSRFDSQCPTIYSPANEAIEYRTITFHTSFWDNDPSEYQGPPGPKTDSLWDDLYGFGISSLTKEEAAPMMNRTDRLLVAGEPQYVTELAVFHQLHCLNTIRMAFAPEHYPDRADFLHPDHISHCIDSIRQALQCNADVTPLPWQWVPEVSEYRGRLGIPHVCRDFDKIREWARPRKLKAKVNQTYRIDEDYE